jgi:uncharacterized protein
VEYESDPAKALINQRKHGVAFDEAATCLLDPMALVREDDDAIGEQRYVLVGMSEAGRTLTVCYTMRGEIPRVISARKATKKEQQSYAQGI